MSESRGDIIGDKNSLAQKHMGLVHSCCKHFTGKGVEYEELFSAGCLGLAKAVERFDESRGLKFSTYAVPVILGEIKRIFRDGGSVRVSRTLKELSMKICRLNTEYEKNNGREMSVTELSQALNVSEDKICEALSAGSSPLSLNAYSSKWMLLFIPSILVLFSIIYAIYAKVKENDENYKSYRKYAVRCIVSIFTFLFLFFWMLIALVLQNKVNIDNLFLPLICIFMGCMFVYLFNLMPKIKQNSLLGIRTNATLSSKSVWKKVHRFAAYFGVICGIAVIILGIISLFIINISNVLFFISIIIVLVSAIVPAIYGEIIYSKKRTSNNYIE